MKKIALTNKKLGLSSLTIRQLTATLGGITIETRPQSYGCPSQEPAATGCRPPKSDSCFSECGCQTEPA